MVYDANEYYISSMDKDRPYYFQIEPFNKNGIRRGTATITAE